MDYSLLSRKSYEEGEIGALPPLDVFMSAYNGSERVDKVFEGIVAERKVWLIHREYDLDEEQMPVDGRVWRAGNWDEAKFWRRFRRAGYLEGVPEDADIGVDITGLMRPHLMLLPKFLREWGFRQFYALYSTPLAYQADEDTEFSRGPIQRVRQVLGFEGVHEYAGGAEEVLLVGSGFEDELIWCVAESRRGAKKVQLFGLPSLQPHMYEQNRLSAARRRAAESIGPLSRRSIIFAPAGDPFMTAQILHDRVKQERREKDVNIYLSSLSTKAQALGFALYYLCECVGEAVSIVLPYAEYYKPRTSVGLSRVSVFRVELDWFI